ncbi:hypothetical protein [Paenimyroides ceti]
MRNIHYIIVLMLLIVSCKSKQKYQYQWTAAYKANVFCSCLKNLDVQLKNDSSPSLNFQILGNFNLINETDSLGKVYATIIKERNIWYKGGDLEGYNNIINGCLEFYQSKDLKILSKKRYKEVNKKH